MPEKRIMVKYIDDVLNTDIVNGSVRGGLGGGVRRYRTEGARQKATKTHLHPDWLASCVGDI